MRSPTLTGSELAFLKDVAIMPNSGVVARYTRLGLSGRQGDKAKQSLLAAGLLEEDEKLTPKGRMKVLRLTEKGMEAYARFAVADEANEP